MEDDVFICSHFSSDEMSPPVVDGGKGLKLLVACTYLPATYLPATLQTIVCFHQNPECVCMCIYTMFVCTGD